MSSPRPTPSSRPLPGARPSPGARRPHPAPAGARPAPGGMAARSATPAQTGVRGDVPVDVSVDVVPDVATVPSPAGAGGPSRAARVWRTVRRHPSRVQRTAIGGVIATIAAVTALATAAPAATVDAHRAPTRPARTTLPPATDSAPLAVTTPTPTRTAHPSVPAKPHAKAPVDHGAISALAANGIPAVALNAYRVAAARMANADPGCGIPWYLLAGIGREESDHGRFGGAVLHSDGISTPKIIGPALDGKHWDYIPAPADGLALDGDAVYAHALGPMQFIPSTWDIYGTDADGDGRADIFDINDAALTAARYLCAAGGDLTGTAGQTRAVLAYNHNDQYLAQVLALAQAYRTGVPVSGIPVGNVTGGLPAVTAPKHLPPANPGAPTANGGGSAKSGSHGGHPSSTPTRHPGGSGSSGPGSSGSGSASSGSGSSGSGSSGSGSSGSGSSGSGSSGSGSGGSTGSGGTTPPSGGHSSSPTPTPKPSPTPSGTSSPTCNPLQQLFGQC